MRCYCCSCAVRLLTKENLNVSAGHMGSILLVFEKIRDKDSTREKFSRVASDKLYCHPWAHKVDIPELNGLSSEPEELTEDL